VGPPWGVQSHPPAGLRGSGTAVYAPSGPTRQTHRRQMEARSPPRTRRSEDWSLMQLHHRRCALIVIAALSLWTASCVPTAQAGAVPPTVDSFDPASGPEGTVVTITGSGFTSATAVTFNGTNASFTVDSGVQITATVPVGATTGPIAVTTPGGTDASATNFTVTTLPTPAPTVSSFTPTRGDLFTQVTIQGSDFTGATLVTIGGCDVPFTVDSDAQITATVGEGAKTGRIRVTTPAGTGTSAQPFTVTRRDHRSTLSLRIREHLLARGKVRVPDGYNGCKFRRVVRIQRKTSHGWESVGNDRSARSGRYKTQLPDKPGRYRAEVTKEALHYDLCEDATSRARRHRHHSGGGGGDRGGGGGGGGGCDPAYPTVCIPSPPPDLDCGDVRHTNFRVRPPDPHNFDGNGDRRGCE
jgi:uncharacterized membrane protein YgcG